MTDPFVVVGGDAAGLSAASKARREADREVVVLERGQWVSYAHCGMPYYVKGAVDRLTDLLSLRPADVADRGIDLRRGHEVVGIDTDDESVAVRRVEDVDPVPDGALDDASDGPDGIDRDDGGGDRYRLPYDDLLVATGARARESPFDLDRRGAFTMHEMDVAAALRAYLRSDPDPSAIGGPYVDRDRVARYADLSPPSSVAVVGGGYVGVEMAEAFCAHDLTVHLFQRPDRPLVPFGEAVGDRVADHLRDRGVNVHLGMSVDRIVGDPAEAVVASGVSDGSDSPDDSDHDAADDPGADDRGAGDAGEAAVEDFPDAASDADRYPVDAVVVGIGVLPNAELIADTPVERGDSGAIAVDRYGRTSVDGVYAAGDCAEDYHAVTGAPAWVPLGLTANRAGRAVGATVAGDPTPVGTVAGTAVVKAFDLGAGRTGLVAPDRARAAGFDPVTETVTAGSRSGYYPGAAETTVTLTADRSGRLLGGATVGRDRAAKRVDTVATAVDAGLSVDELERLDLGYAPPFSPVWDPVLVAAKVLNGRIDG